MYLNTEVVEAEVAEMTNKVRGYLLNRKRDLEQEIDAIELEIDRLKDMLEETHPNIIKRYRPIESGYRILFKNKNSNDAYEFITHVSERDRTPKKVSIWPCLYSAECWIRYYSNIYDCKIIDKDGNEYAEPEKK